MRNKASIVIFITVLLMMVLTACGASNQVGDNVDTSQGGGATTNATNSNDSNGANNISPEIKNIRISTSVRGIGFLPLFVADKKGFFKEEGLEVEIVPFRGGAQNSQAVLGGAVEIGAGAMAEPITSYMADQPITSFFSVCNFPVYKWYTTPDLTLDQLKSRPVKAGISSIGSLSDILMRWALRNAGFDLNNVEFVGVGSATERVAALKSKQVDIISTDPPGTFQLEDEGLKPILDMKDYSKDFQYEVFYAKDDFVKDNPNTIIAMLRGYIHGIQHMKENPEEAADVLMEVLGLDPSQKNNAVKAVNLMKDSGFPENGEFSVEGTEILLEYYKEHKNMAKDTTIEDFTTDQFINYFNENPYLSAN